MRNSEKKDGFKKLAEILRKCFGAWTNDETLHLPVGCDTIKILERIFRTERRLSGQPENQNKVLPDEKV